MSSLTIQPQMVEHQPNPGIFPHRWRAVTTVLSPEHPALVGVTVATSSNSAEIRRAPPVNRDGGSNGDMLGQTSTRTVARLQNEPNSISDFTCERCNITFRTVGLLTNHRHRKHERRFRCSACTESVAFHLRADLERHNRAKHAAIMESNIAKRGYRCTEVGCKMPDKVWTRMDNFRRHVGRCRKAAVCGT